MGTPNDKKGLAEGPSTMASQPTDRDLTAPRGNSHPELPRTPADGSKTFLRRAWVRISLHLGIQGRVQLAGERSRSRGTPPSRFARRCRPGRPQRPGRLEKGKSQHPHHQAGRT